MLSANKEKLQSFYMGSNQFVIPFFQRSYVWKKDNWQELWDSIIEELRVFQTSDQNSEHFIGTIIIKQAETEKLGTLVYDLVDGQQRLTTICVLLRALHDSTDDDALKNWIYTLLVNDSYGKQNIRIIHSKVDRDYFQNIILNDEDNNAIWDKAQSNIDGAIEANNKILGAYLFFRDKIEYEIDASEIRDFVTILLEKLPVIHMALSKNDDVQQIFDTINSLGVKLTTGELLKNYLFSNKTVEPKYKEYWQDIFEADEDAIDFWNAEKTSGRIIRTTIELFLYSYLVILKEDIIKLESLFKEYKEYLKNKRGDELLAFAKDLSEYAKLYATMPDGENLVDINFKEHDKRFFHVMRQLDITTVFPLILFIYKNIKDINERNNILNCLESYLVRRNICKLTTKNYNNLFITLLVELKKQKTFTTSDLKNKLLSFTEDTNRFPDNDELKKAFNTSHLINQYSREILYCIALYHLDNDYQDNRKLNDNGFSVEHIMPKKWRNNWAWPTTGNEFTRDSILLTLGNLTLIKGKLNSALRDAAWDVKKNILMSYSTLRQTTNYLAFPGWDEEIIAARANDLYNAAISIWKR